MSVFKFSAILLVIVLCFTSCSGGGETERYFNLGFYEEDNIPATVYLSKGEIAAVDFYAADDFSGVDVLAAKMSEDDVLTMTLYRYTGSYEQTLKSGTIVEKATFTDYESRDTLFMSFRTEGAGRYLLTFTTKSTAGICLAAFPSEEAADSVSFFLNGALYSEGAFYSSVIFNGNRLNIDYFKEPTVTPPVEEPTEEPEKEPVEETEEEPSGEPVPDEENRELPEEEPEE